MKHILTDLMKIGFKYSKTNETKCFLLIIPIKLNCLNSQANCTLGEDLYLRIFFLENLFFNYQKIRTDILTIDKKFHNF